MSNVLRGRKQATPDVALSNSDKLRPVEPAYWKPVSPSPVAGHLEIPSEPTEWKAPVVLRGQRRNGMRYLYSHGGVRQPLSQIGTPGPDIGNAVWISDFQPDLVTLKDWGFNDALYQAGYPGFNLGLSFKVQKLPENQTGGPGYNMRAGTSLRQNKVRRQIPNVTYNRTG
jgi:hypothetical protein